MGRNTLSEIAKDFYWLHLKQSCMLTYLTQILLEKIDNKWTKSCRTLDVYWNPSLFLPPAVHIPELQLEKSENCPRRMKTNLGKVKSWAKLVHKCVSVNMLWLGGSRGQHTHIVIVVVSVLFQRKPRFSLSLQVTWCGIKLEKELFKWNKNKSTASLQHIKCNIFTDSLLEDLCYPCCVSLLIRNTGTNFKNVVKCNIFVVQLNKILTYFCVVPLYIPVFSNDRQISSVMPK